MAVMIRKEKENEERGGTGSAADAKMESGEATHAERLHMYACVSVDWEMMKRKQRVSLPFLLSSFIDAFLAREAGHIDLSLYRNI